MHFLGDRGRITRVKRTFVPFKMTTFLRTWRQKIPARVSEVLAALSLTATCMLFIHTNHLQNQLQLYSTQLRGTGDDMLTNSKLEYGNYDKGMERSPGTHRLKDILNQYRHLDPRSLNLTKPDARLVLMFNRVPKVGSQTTMELMRMMSYENGFSYHKDQPKKTERIKLTVTERTKLVQMIGSFRPPTVYVKHVCYINFTALGETQPIYMNMVRDPVERAISWYYYVRAPWYFVERKHAFPDLQLPSSQWLRKDYETCVRRKDKECRYEEGQVRPDFAQLTEFFCGQEKNCSGFNTEYAFKRAIENVEKHYAVVGVLEEMNMTLTVLEHYLPRFFTGAKQLYFEKIHRFSKINKNIYKPKVSNEVKDIARKNFTREIEFYEYCKQRLYKQYAALNLPLDSL